MLDSSISDTGRGMAACHSASQNPGGAEAQEMQNIGQINGRLHGDHFPGFQTHEETALVFGRGGDPSRGGAWHRVSAQRRSQTHVVSESLGL